MGCASSKQVKAAVAADVYRPSPTSIAVFDINTVEEPWLITTTTTTTEEEEEEEEEEKKEQKPNQLPLILLEKLDSNELTPHSWSEVSKALEELKPSLTQITPTPTPKKQQKQQTPPPSQSQTNNTPRNLEIAGLRPVKENMFIIQDREQRENNKTDTDTKKWRRRDPFEGYPDGPPPGNPDGVVLYTTSLRGVRRTFEDCEQARRIVEGNAVDVGIDVDERDVSLHGEFLKEVRELAGEAAAAVPRLFIRGKYVGGAEEVLELSESGKLREMMRWVATRGSGKEGRRGGNCEGCGGARFVPCFECNGSCKVVAEDGKEVVRCGECNENGLVLCPLCH